MCGISGVELAIIIVAAIIILGPDKLPDVLRMLARLTHHARSALGDLQRVGTVLDKDFPRKQIERTVKEEILDPVQSAGKPRQRQRVRDARIEEQIDRIRRERARVNAGADGDESDGELQGPPPPELPQEVVAASTESTAPFAARKAEGNIPRTTTATPGEADSDAP